jgi:hypothetical protein
MQHVVRVLYMNSTIQTGVRELFQGIFAISVGNEKELIIFVMGFNMEPIFLDLYSSIGCELNQGTRVHPRLLSMYQ